MAAPVQPGGATADDFYTRMTRPETALGTTIDFDDQRGGLRSFVLMKDELIMGHETILRLSTGGRPSGHPARRPAARAEPCAQRGHEPGDQRDPGHRPDGLRQHQPGPGTIGRRTADGGPDRSNAACFRLPRAGDQFGGTATRQNETRSERSHRWCPFLGRSTDAIIASNPGSALTRNA